MTFRVLPIVAVLLAACSSLPITIGEPTPEERAERAARAAAREAEALAEAMAEARAEVPSSPADVPPREDAARVVWQAALDARGTRIVVSRDARALWLLGDGGVVFRAPVAVGKHESFEYAGRRYDFTTPIGRRKVLGKGTDPLWVPPDWHYYEIAVAQKLEPVRLAQGAKIALADSTFIVVRGADVGRVNRFGNFWPFTPGNEIIFDDRIFIPPFGTNQLKVPEVLGTHKLELGDGYLIHGTNEAGSIGDAVSHGCVRMFNDDVAFLFDTVDIGTAVFVY